MKLFRKKKPEETVRDDVIDTAYIDKLLSGDKKIPVVAKREKPTTKPLPFMPFGYLLPKAYRNVSTLWKVLLLGLVFVLFAETGQLITNLGTFDVDDIILNMFAIFVGYLPVGIGAVLRKKKRKKKK